MASVSGIFLGLGLADSPQAKAQTVEDVVQGPLRRHRHLRWRSRLRCGRGLRQQLLTHRLGRDARERQRGLEFRIGLASRFDDSVNPTHQRRIQLFGLVPTSRREIIQTTNAGAQLVQPRLDGVPPPAEELFRLPSAALAILPGHFRLKLPTQKPREFPSRRLNRLSHRIGQFGYHGLFLETET
jgi:hypothetical protein